MNTHDWINATPEQFNLWKLVNGLIAWTTITPLYYQGAIAASEFLTYAAGKLYIALEFEAGAGSLDVANGNIVFYDMANSINFYSWNTAIVWNTTGAAVNYLVSNIVNKNIWFSRINKTNYTYMKFNGYRLNT
jgi:hypothetical protein